MAGPEIQEPSGGAADFPRPVIEVRELFRQVLERYLADGRIADKERFEQERLRLSAGLINALVAGGVLLFREQEPEGPEDQGPPPEAILLEQRLDGGELLILLRRTLLTMLRQLNQPETDLLRLSLSRLFRRKLREVFAAGAADDFPVKLFQDRHPGGDCYLGINLRNTRSLGDDLDRIERNPILRATLIAGRRSLRHDDQSLRGLLVPPPAAETA